MQGDRAQEEVKRIQTVPLVGHFNEAIRTYHYHNQHKLSVSRRLHDVVLVLCNLAHIVAKPAVMTGELWVKGSREWDRRRRRA
jgi:hypothetical protein